MNKSVYAPELDKYNAYEFRALLFNKIFLFILIAGLFLRLYFALTTTYIWDEERSWIPLAQTISFHSESLNLPIRGEIHGALSAYFIKFGSLIFGETILGFRILNVLAGVATIVTVALVAHAWAGTSAALWTAVLMAFNEFHIAFSAFAIQTSFFLFFSSLATFTFVLSLLRDNPRWLYATAAFTGLGFLCYEIAALLGPVFFLTILFSKHREWFLKKHPYIASFILISIIFPDLYWNYYGGGNKLTYEDHLSRVSGIGFSKYYLMFFFRDAQVVLYEALGKHLYNTADDYPAMNSTFGFILFTIPIIYSSSFLIIKKYRKDTALYFLLIYFWFIFMFFSVSKAGVAPAPGEANFLWIWLALILFPAAIMAGAYISRQGKPVRRIVIPIVCLGILYSVYNVLYWRLDAPSHTVAFSPEFIDPAAGDMVEVHARINFCILCDRDVDFALVDIGVLQNDNSLKSVFDTGDVEGAERGARDTSFKLRPVIDPDGTLWVGRIYHITYRIPDFLGNQKLRVGVVRVPRNPSQSYGDVFWALSR